MLISSVSLAVASLGAVRAALLQPPTAIPVRNFTQLLNHNSNDSMTFDHAYQIDMTYFRAGGPILFYQEAENAQSIGTSDAINGNIFIDYAEELGAMRLCLEHRFFGTSFPEGFNASDPRQYNTLNLDNVVQDAVAFIEYIKKTVPEAENSTVILTGGSYGGFLATIFKLRAPDTFYGSIAHSPSLYDMGPLVNNTGKYHFHNWVTNVYYDASDEAANKIKSAMRIFQKCSTEGDCSSISGFNFCDPQPNVTSVSTLYEALLLHYGVIAKFNLGIPAVYPFPYPLDMIVNKTLAANTTGAVLRAPLEVFLNSSSTECLDWQSPQIATSVFGAAGQSWWVIQCHYFFVPGKAIPEDDMLPTQNTEGRLDCTLDPEWWGSNYNHSAEWFKDHYGLSAENLDKVKRLLIINGQYDPGSAASLPGLTLSSSRNHSRVLNVGQSGHTESSFPLWAYPRGIKATIDEARDTQLEYIKAWLGMDSGGTAP